MCHHRSGRLRLDGVTPRPAQANPPQIHLGRLGVSQARQLHGRCACLHQLDPRRRPVRLRKPQTTPRVNEADLQNRGDQTEASLTGVRQVFGGYLHPGHIRERGRRNTLATGHQRGQRRFPRGRLHRVTRQSNPGVHVFDCLVRLVRVVPHRNCRGRRTRNHRVTPEELRRKLCGHDSSLWRVRTGSSDVERRGVVVARREPEYLIGGGGLRLQICHGVVRARYHRRGPSVRDGCQQSAVLDQRHLYETGRQHHGAEWVERVQDGGLAPIRVLDIVRAVGHAIPRVQERVLDVREQRRILVEAAFAIVALAEPVRQQQQCRKCTPAPQRVIRPELPRPVVRRHLRRILQLRQSRVRHDTNDLLGGGRTGGHVSPVAHFLLLLRCVPRVLRLVLRHRAAVC